MKILLVTFSDNADHQDITFSMYEQLYDEGSAWLMCIKEPKVSVKGLERVSFVDCPSRPGVCKKTFDLKTLFQTIKWIKEQKFDVVFFESLHVWNLPIMILKNKNTRVFQMIHDLIPHEGDRQAKMVSLMNKVVCILANKIVLCNEKYLEVATEMYGVPKGKLTHIDMWRRFPEYTEPEYTKRILFFGRINPYKGIENLIEIVKMCPEIQFDVVGRVDDEMIEMVAKLEKEPNVTLQNGYVTGEAMETAFVNCDWVILPYKSATQSGVVIDAYRYSRPVIAFDVGAISEQIKEGVSGYLIPEGTVDSFADKLKEVVVMQREEYKVLCKQAYEFGSQKYAAIGAKERFMRMIECVVR